MFAELPKLIDRNYLIGFFLPAVMLSAAFVWLLWLFGVVTENPLPKSDNLLATATGIGLVWIVSILLMALNVPAIRLIEGYGGWNPLRLLTKQKEARFASSVMPVIATQAQMEAARSTQNRIEAPGRHAADLRRAVEEYPDRAAHVLPTAFGNRYRAFEVYSRVVYGLDSIPAWPRLQAVMPEAYKELLSTARARLNFCVNLQLIGLTTFIAFLGLAIALQQWPTALPPLASLALLLAGYRLALGAASEYGIYVKAAFDLYRGELARKLGLEIPLDPAAERRMWGHVSRMMIYRSAPRYDDLRPYREPAGPAGKPNG